MNKLISIARGAGKTTMNKIMCVYKTNSEMEMLEVRTFVYKSWTNRRGEKIYRIDARYEILKWLEEEYSQFGQSNPLWWKFAGGVNVTEEMMLIINLKWSN